MGPRHALDGVGAHMGLALVPKAFVVNQSLKNLRGPKLDLFVHNNAYLSYMLSFLASFVKGNTIYNQLVLQVHFSYLDGFKDLSSNTYVVLR